MSKEIPEEESYGGELEKRAQLGEELKRILRHGQCEHCGMTPIKDADKIRAVSLLADLYGAKAKPDENADWRTKPDGELETYLRGLLDGFPYAKVVVKGGAKAKSRSRS